MSRLDPRRSMAPTPWELIGFLAYLAALLAGLGPCLAWSLRHPEFALLVIPFVGLALHWDDRRREVARHAMPIPGLATIDVIDPLWDREIDG